MTSLTDTSKPTTDVQSEALLKLSNLTVAFPTNDGPAYAVNEMDLTLQKGKTLGLVGESGCGKSMTSLAVLGLVPRPGQVTQGDIMFKSQNLSSLSQDERRKLRGSQIALIPQDPLTSLNPVYTIGDQINEVLILHKGMNNDEASKRTAELLDMVRIPNAKDRLKDYPHQFSGGMRQRVMIAMALSCTPELLIADEPTTALDVTVQAQILDLMRELQREHNMGILLITHDLGVVAEMCDDVAVMYAGRKVESAPAHDLFKKPNHPYTQGLLNSLPTIHRKRLQPIEGHPPALTRIPQGCSFEPRCPESKPECRIAFPATFTPEKPEHQVACYLYGDEHALD